MSVVMTGAWIRTLRVRHGLTQVEFARALGVTDVTVNRWEGGKAVPLPVTRRRLYRAHVEGISALRRKAKYPPKQNLPHTPPLIGRKSEIDRLDRVLVGGKHVSIVGPAGVGKTHLAIEVARQAADRFPEGVWFVDLSTLGPEPDRAESEEGTEITMAVAKVLGLPEDVHSTPVKQLHSRLRGSSMLVVLDSCDHVRRAVADFIDECLSPTGDSVVLVTSSEPIWSIDEKVIRIEPLPTASAVDLFVRSAESSRQGMRFDERDRTAIENLCRRLDGLPLAIELAASRTSMLSIDQITRRIEQRIELLRREDGTEDPQAVLDATIQWSIDLLQPDELVLFRQLGIFAGWFELTAAEVVCEVPRTLDGLTRLAQQSMIVVNRGEHDRPTRYRMLNSLAGYAYRLIVEAGEGETISTRHARWYASIAHDFGSALRGPDQAMMAAALDRDYDNLVRALKWWLWYGDPESALEMAIDLAPYWQRLGLYLQGWVPLIQALVPNPDVDQQLRLRGLIVAGLHSIHSGMHEPAAAILDEALALAELLGDKRSLAQTKDKLGLLQREGGDLVLARSMHEESFAIWSELGERQGKALARFYRGNLHNIAGDSAAAERDYLEAAALITGTGDLLGEAGIRISLGELVRRTGSPERAIDYIQQAIETLETIGDVERIAFNQVNLAEARILLRQYDEALMTVDRAMATLHTSGKRILLAGGLYLQGIALAGVGDHAKACDAFREALISCYVVRDLAESLYVVEVIGALLIFGGKLKVGSRLYGSAIFNRKQADIPDYPLIDYASVDAILKTELQLDIPREDYGDLIISPDELVESALRVGRLRNGKPIHLCVAG